MSPDPDDETDVRSPRGLLELNFTNILNGSYPKVTTGVWECEQGYYGTTDVEILGDNC